MRRQALKFRAKRGTINYGNYGDYGNFGNPPPSHSLFNPAAAGGGADFCLLALYYQRLNKH